MRIVNRDMTRESIVCYVTRNQIYARIWNKSHGKWESTTYFVSYDFDIDQELIISTVRYIKRTWGLKNPITIISYK